MYIENKGQLYLRTVNVAHFNKNSAIVTTGFKPNDKLITSALLNAVEGMNLMVEK